MDQGALHPVVEGEIVIPPEAPVFRGAVGRVFLEDVSRIDASAEVVLTETLPGLEHAPNEETRIPFLLCGAVPSERAHYSIRVHIDRQGDGEIREGDLITKQSYPVAVGGAVVQLEVAVSEIA